MNQATQKEKPGVRSIWDLFALHRPIPAVRTSASSLVSKKELAEQKRLKRQQRNLCHVSGFTSNKGKLA